MILSLTFLFLCIVSVYSGTSEESSEKWDFLESAGALVDSQWEEFKLNFNKHYKDETEERRRKKIFVEESIKIAKRNQLFVQGLVSTSSRINQFGDLTFDEFLEKVGNCYTKLTQSEIDEAATFVPPAHVTRVATVDWRQNGAVTEVKDQGMCGSCYAFSATGALEAQHFLKHKVLVPLSEQNLVDCSRNEGNKGCKGGHSIKSFQYIKKNDGIDTEASYPYEGAESQCRYNPANKGATVKGHEIVSGEANLTIAVATRGPVAVAIDVRPSFQHCCDDVDKVYYEPECDPKNPVHAVLVVGYGTDPKDPHPDYWIVKNSWGTAWGDKGYIKMARNVDNDCGISGNWGTYPTL